MKATRRNLLKGGAATALALQAGVRLSWAGATRTLRRVRPSDPAWPSAASWQKLNNAVGGNLIKVQSLFAPCERDAASAACVDVENNLRNPFYLGDQPGGTQVCGWLDAWTPAPSAYAVKVRNAADVAAVVNFARDKNLRLVVKGTGHSYQGTSNAPDSLLVWTHAMNAVTLHDSFVAKGCVGKMKPVPAVTAEAGAVWIDLYNAVTTQGGRYVQGGGCTDVGVAGLVQSGGFGSFSKGFGTAAANLLEAEIVTADGVVRTVSPCSEPDLFWAIKGGGGGSWGVVTKVTLRTYDLPQFFGYAGGTIKAQSDDAYRKLVARFVDFYAANLLNPHWGEGVTLHSDNTFEIGMACHGLGKDQIKQLWQPFFDWVAASPQDYSVTDELDASAGESRHWWAAEGNRAMIRDTRAGAPSYHGWWRGDQAQVGMFLYGYDSLWLPVSLLKADQRQRLVDALFESSQRKVVRLHFNKGLAGADDDTLSRSLDTATNPTMAGAFALAIVADGGAPDYPGMPHAATDMAAAEKDARAIAAATAILRALAPNAGSYVSESNYFNPKWQTDYWGTNYAKLAAVKAKYDPDGLFFVHNGVGSEAWSRDGFTRLANG